MMLLEETTIAVPWELLGKHGGVWGLIVGLFFTLLFIIIKSSDKLNKNISKSWIILLITILCMAYSFGLLAFFIPSKNVPPQSSASVFDYTIFLRDSTGGYSTQIEDAIKKEELILLTGNVEPGNDINSKSGVDYKKISANFQNKSNTLELRSEKLEFLNGKNHIRIFLTGSDTMINVKFKKEKQPLGDDSTFVIYSPVSTAGIVSTIQNKTGYHLKNNSTKNIIKIFYDTSSNALLEDINNPGKFIYNGSNLSVLVNGKICFTSTDRITPSPNVYQSKSAVLNFINTQANVIISNNTQRIVDIIIQNIK